MRRQSKRFWWIAFGRDVQSSCCGGFFAFVAYDMVSISMVIGFLWSFYILWHLYGESNMLFLFMFTWFHRDVVFFSLD